MTGVDHFAPSEKGSLNILIAEDNPVNAKILSLLLERKGHRTEVVENGRDAVNAFRDGHFDLIFMDLQMPLLDGLRAAREIRLDEQKTRTIPIPIIAVTAHVGCRDKCISAGMDDYMTKPVDSRSLCQVLSRWGNSSAWDRQGRPVTPEELS